MTRAKSVASLVTLLLAAACVRPAPTLGPASDADVEAVAAILATFDSCGRVGALDEVISHSADDVVLLAPDQPAVVGRDAVRELYKGSYAAVALDMQHRPLETQSLGELVISRGTASGTATPRAGGPSTTFDNKYLQLFRRQSDGTLKAWRVAFNTNAPPVAPGRAP